MIDREKVIKGLECHKRAMYGKVDEHGLACNTCPYKDMESTCHTMTEGQLMEDALALLRAQEPRILNFDELHRGMVCYYEDMLNHVFTRVIGGVTCYGATCFIYEYGINIAPENAKYGVTWRCWTSCPIEKIDVYDAEDID